MNTPQLSIITVCYCAKNDLSITINNVLKQTWDNFEYIVIDGGSSDGTSELLQESIPLFHEKHIPFHFISEPDKGIYDAMNKGSRIARGEWLLFLNAGDLLATNDTLQTIFSYPTNADVIYGDSLCTYEGNTKLYPALPLDHLKYEMAFCHQSVLIRRKEMLAHPYDISYKVCADHRLFLILYLEGKVFDYRNIPISVYEIAGYSDKNKLRSHKEKIRIQKELGIFKISFSWFKRECIFYVKQGIKQLFGQHLIDLVRKNRLH